MILLDFSKPLILRNFGGFVNKLETSFQIKATGQRTLLSKSSFVIFGDSLYLQKGQTTAQCSGRRSVLKRRSGGFSKVQALKNDLQSISGLSTEKKPTIDLNLSTSASLVAPFLPFLAKQEMEGVLRKAAAKTQATASPQPHNKNIYTSYSKRTEVKLLTIGIASPLRILQWAEKTLPNGKIYGEVLNANTLHHKTFKPQKGGLFCERIFGPLKDFECACGKIDKSIKYNLRFLRTVSASEQEAQQAIEGQRSTALLSPKEIEQAVPVVPQAQETKETTQVSEKVDESIVKKRKYCPECDVEYTWSVIRRYQLGYIKLNSPVTHVWFLKGTPSYLSILLDFKKRHLQNVTYCSESLTLEYALLQPNKPIILDSASKIFKTWQSLVNKSTFPSRAFVELPKKFDNKPLVKTTFEKNNANKESTSHVQAQEKLKLRRVLHQQLSPLPSLRSLRESEKEKTPFKKWCQNITSPISHNNSIKKEIAQCLLALARISSKGVGVSASAAQEHIPENKANKYKDFPYLSAVNKSNTTHRRNEKSQSPKLEIKGNTAFADVKKGSFLLSFLQLSVYYNSSLFKKKNDVLASRTPFDKDIQPSSIFEKRSFLKNPQILNNFFFKKEKSALLLLRKTISQKSALEKTLNYRQNQSRSEASLFASAFGRRETAYFLKEKASYAALASDEGAKKVRTSVAAPSAQARESPLELRSNRSVPAPKAQQPQHIQILKEISQKLPIDFYILSTLERLLHKQALLLSINKTWSKIYKKAYFNAMHKAMKMAFFKKTSIENRFSSFSKQVHASLVALTRESPLELRSNRSVLQAPLLLFTQNEMETPLEETTRKNLLSSFYKRKEKEAYKTSAKNINLVLKRIKKDFRNHILMAFQNIKQPVLALKHTTQIQNSNTQTTLKVSSEIEEYLLLNTDPMTKLLSNVFLQSFLVGNLLEKMAFIVNKKNGVNFAFDKGSANFKANKYNTKKDIASQFPKNSLHFYKTLLRLQKWQKTSVPASLAPTVSALAPTALAQPASRTGYSLGVGAEKASPSAQNEEIALKEIKNFLNSKLAFCPSFASSPLQGNKKRCNVALSEKESAKFDLRKGMGNSEYFENKTNVYNNVYVLSHRERWRSEKDWQFLRFYNSGFSEYTDIPIHTYKNRLSLASQNWEFNLFSELTSLHSPTLHSSPAPKAQALESPLELRSNRSVRTVQVQNELREKVEKYQTKEEFPLNYTLSSAFYSGAGIVRQLLNELSFGELKKLDKQNRMLLYQLNRRIFSLKRKAEFYIYDTKLKRELKEIFQKRDLLMRRTKIVRKIFRKDSDPSSMVLTVLPVLPPDLRPIVKMGNQIAASDLNRLYQRVIYRNDRLKKFLKDPATSNSFEMKYAQRLLQEAVDNLIQNGKSGVNSEKDSRGRLLKSLSDLLKGKQGRFRQFLLGKRVDYSGRSVIVVGPKCKLYECGIPLEMAKELYFPFLLKSILNKNYARTVIGAKSLIRNNPALAHELLRDIMRASPVLLNRAPTLHRLGIQAFVPKLVEGRAILLHPLVCSAFNADFDGDQMAVHVPITVEARAEAWKLMLARNNILSPATGEPLAIPSQDMVLGCYFLTTYSNQNNASARYAPTLVKKMVAESKQGQYVTSKVQKVQRSGAGSFFNNLYDVLNAYNQQKIHLHALVWVKWLDSIENGSDQEEPSEIRMASNGHWQAISANYLRFYDSNNILISQYMATTPGRIFFNLLIQKIRFYKSLEKRAPLQQR